MMPFNDKEHLETRPDSLGSVRIASTYYIATTLCVGQVRSHRQFSWGGEHLS